jgi:HEAT repeat protein
MMKPNRILPLLALAAGAAFAPAGVASPALAAGYATQDAAAEGRSDRYREGQRALSESRWQDAARIFRQIADAGGADADAGRYWQAYAEARRQQKKEALEAIRRLRADHPESPWIDDAAALEIELRGRAPEEAQSSELKLYALEALLMANPERATPVLEKLVMGDETLEVKRRAMFVLSQSDDPKAREILIRVATAGEPLALRREAVQALGIAGEDEDLAALGRILADGNAPVEVREAVLNAYLIADRDEDLLRLARTDPDPQLRARAIDLLGAMEASDALRQLWDTERDPRLRAKLLDAFGIAGDVELLARIAASESDPTLRRKAIDGLGIADTDEAARALTELYGRLTDVADRRKVLDAFLIQDNAKALIELFRKEQDPVLKRSIVQHLGMMDDPEATELLLELLGEKP